MKFPIVNYHCGTLTTGRTTMADNGHTTTWPDLAIGLYDRLTGRGAEITYDFDDMRMKIPSGTGPEAEHAEWVFSGKLKISTKDNGSDPN